jgi:quercetin dioxygenase-like cupin family protein
MTDLSEFPYQVLGEERERVLARVRGVIAGWGLTMPSAYDPLVLDFGLGCFSETGEVEFWVINEEENGYCGKFLFVDDGQTCPYHEHARKHETFMVMKGQVKMVVDGTPRIMNEGDTLVMEPGKRHAFTGIGPALILECSMPSMRGDNFFENRAIGDKGTI